MALKHAYAPAIIALGSLLAANAFAQTSSVRFQIGGTARVDCDRPVKVKNFPLGVEGRGVLNSDRSTTADLEFRKAIFVDKIHFDGRLGAGRTPAPYGSAEVHVTGPDRLHLVWSLPNNDVTLDVVVRGKSCSANLGYRLKPGKREYSFYDGYRLEYCAKPRVEQIRCQVN
jgi:hypothetical protein